MLPQPFNAGILKSDLDFLAQAQFFLLEKGCVQEGIAVHNLPERN